MNSYRTTQIAQLVAAGKISLPFADICREGYALEHEWLPLSVCVANSGVPLWALKSKLTTRTGALVPVINNGRALFVYVPALSMLFPNACFYSKESDND